MPFHYGSWDADDTEPSRAANELTITDWDPGIEAATVQDSGRPDQSRRQRRRQGRPAPTNTASSPVEAGIARTTGGTAATAAETVGGAA